MSVLMLFKIIWILPENILVSRNLAKNSNSRQNTANRNIGQIFGLARFIFLKLLLGSLSLSAKVCEEMDAKRRFAGKLFHARGPATAKFCVPSVSFLSIHCTLN